MRTLELRTADGRCVAHHVHMACSFRSRCIGLLRRRSIPEQEGLLLVPGGSVHTLGMRFNIDVVFLNRQMRVLGVAENVAPWRIVIAPKDTTRVLELAAGKIATTRITAGIYLIVDQASEDPSERPTIKPGARHTPCERAPLQFSLRLPLDRRCMNAGPAEIRSPQPCRPARDARVATKPSVES
ncbi:DUF192 domain-containing protein [Steroidobacter flavus]|uniref:DUF192 domain-containing protein n=1 Tax=Steroidobacter flavus TaxID=1842136 RepID=A0ABV8SRF1_9GAMM